MNRGTFWYMTSPQIKHAGPLRCRIHTPHLHPRYEAEAGRGRTNDGQLHGTGHVSRNTGEKAKASSPVLFGSIGIFPRVGHGVGQAVDSHHFQRFCNKKAPKTEVFDAFCRVSTEKMPFAHHLLYRSEIFFLISGVITFLYCCAISQNWIFSSSVTSFFLHRVLNKVGFPPRKIYRRLSGI